MFTPNSASTSAEPLRLVMLRLPCLATGTPAAAATIAAVVLTLNIFESPPPVPHVSSTSACRDRIGVMCRRIASAAPAISSTVSPLAASAVSSRPIWSSVHWPRMMASKAAAISSKERFPPPATWPSNDGNFVRHYRIVAGTLRVP